MPSLIPLNSKPLRESSRLAGYFLQIMKLKNDPYFPVVAIAMIAALLLSLLTPQSAVTSAKNNPGNPLTTAGHTATHAE